MLGDVILFFTFCHIDFAKVHIFFEIAAIKMCKKAKSGDYSYRKGLRSRKVMNSSPFVLHSSLNLYHFQSKDAFQFLGRESEFELALDGHADSSGLLGYNDGDGITAL